MCPGLQDQSYHSYLVREGRLHPVRAHDPAAAPRHVDLHRRFRAGILGRRFPCLGGASAVRRDHYRVGFYGDLAGPASIEACSEDVRTLVRDLPAETHPVAVYVAMFTGPAPIADDRFEDLLWRQVGGMLDAAPNAARGPGPDEGLDASDPGIFLDGREFFVVGMHPHASRKARRFERPALVFNALSHVRPLLPGDRFAALRDQIRTRDVRLQGDLNPSLDAPRLAQFSGRAVSADWRCPYRPTDLGRPAGHQ